MAKERDPMMRELVRQVVADGRVGDLVVAVAAVKDEAARRERARARHRRYYQRHREKIRAKRRTASDGRRTASDKMRPCGDYPALVAALTERRKALGLSQLDLDERAGWPGGYAGKLEAGWKEGGKTVGAASFPRWLAALGVRLAVVEVLEVPPCAD